MLRVLSFAAALALIAPTLAFAQDDHHPHPPPGAHRSGPPHPGPHPGPGPGPHPALKPAIVPHGPPGTPMAHPMVRPGPGPAAMGPHPGHGQFSYRGHMLNRVHVNPFVYPQGFGYRRWAVGAVLPPVFLVPDYYYPDWAALGLEAPPPGYQWVRYGPDLLLVDVATGQVVDTAYDVFD